MGRLFTGSLVSIFPLQQLVLAIVVAGPDSASDTQFNNSSDLFLSHKHSGL